MADSTDNSESLEERAIEEKRHEDLGPLECAKESVQHALDRLLGIGESPEQKERRKKECGRQKEHRRHHIKL